MGVRQHSRKTYDYFNQLFNLFLENPLSVPVMILTIKMTYHYSLNLALKVSTTSLVHAVLVTPTFSVTRIGGIFRHVIFVMLCNLAYIKNVSTMNFFTVKPKF